MMECAKLRALRTLVPYVPSCLTCLRASIALVPYMSALVLYVPSCLTCPRALRTLVHCMPYVLCVLLCLAILCVFSDLPNHNFLD